MKQIGPLLTKQAWRKRVKRYLYVSQLELFKHFRNGLIYFSVGGIIVYLASSMPASLRQELVILFGLLLCGFGFAYAMLSYTRIVLSRMLIFFKQK